MKRQDIPEKVRNAFTDITPDILENIKNATVVKETEENSIFKQQKPAKKQKYALRACAACIALFLVFGAGKMFMENRVVSIIAIDVNPSIELLANRDDVVMEARALNRDAEKILGSMNLKKVDLEVAVNAIIGSVVRNGYFVQADGDILISVMNRDEEKANEIKTIVIGEIQDFLEASNLSAIVYDQNISAEKDNSETAKAAEAYSISIGKMVLIERLLEIDGSLSVDQLAGMPMRDIASLAERKNIDFNNMVGCHGEIENNIEESQEDWIQPNDGHGKCNSSDHHHK